jgi:preprotein translocase subunit SecY
MSLGGASGDKGLSMKLSDTFRNAWADEDLRKRLTFILLIFAFYSLGIHVPVPIPNVEPSRIAALLESSAFYNLINTLGGGAFKKLSIFALGLGPYISASIIMQVLSFAIPQWKEELKEGGQFARQAQNRRTRFLMLFLCVFQGLGVIQLLGQALPQITPLATFSILVFWTAGSMMMLWMGEQLTEKGIGNGVSLLIFAGICNGIPGVVESVRTALSTGTVNYFQIAIVIALFAAMTWFVVYFTLAQRRIPIEHMRRNFGTKSMGGKTSYLPFAVNLAGVMPIIFALALLGLPSMFRGAFPVNSPVAASLTVIERFLYPDFTRWEGYVGALFYMGMIFFFTFFYTSMQYNVDDIADNLKRGGSFIKGIRPGKQTRDYLDQVMSRVTFVGAGFLAIVALSQYILPLIAPISNLSLIAGTSLLIMVSVALETMRQIESQLIAKQYDS